MRDIFSEYEINHVKPKATEQLNRLYKFDLVKDDFDSLNRAEQVFVAILGKVPESFVANLHNNDPFNPTETTLSEIGSIFGVTGARVGGVLAKALRKMKHPKRIKPLRDSGYLTEESRTNRRWGYTRDVTTVDEREII